jgi:tetrahydromethanopterin S-methyltransferase subunit G
MVENSPKTPSKRAYPQFFEKSIPIAIGILVVIIIGVLIFALAVIIGAI